MGCGSDSDSSSSTSEAAISKAAYIAKADAICKKAEQQQVALVKKLSESGAAEGAESEVTLVREAGLPPLQQQVEELEELPPSKADADQAEAFIEEFASALEQVDEEPKILLNLADENVFADAEATAAKFGFKVCGTP